MNKHLTKQISFFVLLFVLVTCSSAFDLSAQRTSEKFLNIQTGTSTVIEDFNYNNLNSLYNIPNNYTDIDITTNLNDGTVTADVAVGATGSRTITIEYVLFKNGQSFTNYRIYYLTLSPTIVKANDDAVKWDGNGTLIIDATANDAIATTPIIEINDAGAGTATIVNGKIHYSQDDFDQTSYIHYSIKDAAGTHDQAIIKIEPELSYTEDKRFDFVVNFNSEKPVTIPQGYTVSSDPFNGSLTAIDAEHYLYTPEQDFIGQDSFKFESNGLTITYVARVIDAYRDPGVVKNDVVYATVNTPITFDVLANDLVPGVAIDSFSSELTEVSPGVFTFDGGNAGVKNYFYTASTGVGQETGKIKINIGNFTPDRDIQYNIEMLGNTTFVMEYNVPIEGYGFTVATPPSHGIIDIYADSTANYNCGTAYGKIIITYTPDNGYVGEDLFTLNYCVNGAQCKVVTLRPQVVANTTNACNCFNDCVWSGDLDGNGRVNAADLLVLGRYMGAQGPARSGSSAPIWLGSQGQEWGVTSNRGRDIMHADADGDGRLTSADAQAILDQYGKVNALVPKQILGIKDIPFSIIAVPEVVDSGEVQDLYFVLGSEEKPANGVHGISFSVNLGPIDSASLVVDLYKDSWLTADAPSLGMYKQVSNGVVHVGLTRAEGAGIIGEEGDGVRIGGSSGYGVIAKMSIIGEEGDGVRSTKDRINKIINLENIILEGREGELNSLIDNSFNLVQKFKKEKIDTNLKYIIYPNPVSVGEKIFIEGWTKFEKVEFYDIKGKLVLTSLGENKMIDIKELASGMYSVKIYTSDDVSILKLIK